MTRITTFTLLLSVGSVAAASEPRYPSDILIDEEIGVIFTANEAAGSVSALDMSSGERLAEWPLTPRGRPRALGLARVGPEQAMLAVSQRSIHRIALIDLDLLRPPRGTSATSRPLAASGPVRELEIGRLPAALTFRVGGDETPRLLVACEGEDEIWELDPTGPAGGVVRRLRAVEGPRLLALVPRSETASAAESVLVAGRHEVAEIDLVTGTMRWRRAPSRGNALNINGLLVRGDRAFLAHQVRPAAGIVGRTVIVWGLTLVNRVTVLSRSALAEAKASGSDAALAEWSIPLDLRSRAAGDPGVPALVAENGDAAGPVALLVPSSGTDRLLVVDELAPPNPPSDSLTRVTRLPEIAMGARPVVVRATSRNRAYVACSLDDEVLEVDLENRSVVRRLALGPAPQRTPTHLGARIFYDADRSRDGWYSCHSCHPDGGTTGHTFDTMADGTGPPKRVPDLHGVADTVPWSWVARFSSLREQVAASLEKTMVVDGEPSHEDVDHLLAFLSSLDAPAPTRPDEDIAGDPGRGAVVFEDAGCARCHEPPTYTSTGTQDVGVHDTPRGHQRFNPPSLRGVRDRYRYLHDGRASSLEAVLREHNPKGLHGDAGDLSPADLADLVAFLRTL